MVRAMTPLRTLSTARGCARIDSRPYTAKIGPAGRVEVHHALLFAVIGVRIRFHTAWTQIGHQLGNVLFPSWIKPPRQPVGVRRYEHRIASSELREAVARMPRGSIPRFEAT